ncbi:pyridoxal phosphate-dependent transferase [Lactarius hatsudake]|nr:pyridoxal phosphate-dependent transferase [Lactarius hatsudake]
MTALHRHLEDSGALWGPGPPGLPSGLGNNVPIDSEDLEDDDEAVVPGKSQNTSDFDVQLAFRTQRGYPSRLNALAMYIQQPKFPLVLAQFLYKFSHLDELVAPSTIDECPAFEGAIKVHHSAIATFYAPSDLSGSGGLWCERIRSAPHFFGYPHRDTVFVVVGDSQAGMEAMEIGRVLLFFLFEYRRKSFSCALINWFVHTDERDPDTGMWVVKQELDRHGQPTLEVIHVDSIARAAHLLPVYGDSWSSHQNDPGRTVLEILLALFAIHTLLQSRTRADNGEKHFIQFSEKEVDKLVDEWTPEPLGAPLTPEEQADLAYNFTGLAGNETIKVHAIETLRKYGVVAVALLGSTVLLGFSTIPCVISAFAKCGDIITADWGVNFAIQKGLEISRSTVRWFDHNDLKGLEDVLLSVEKEHCKRRGPLTRRFIVTEGIFEKDGAMVDLPNLIELKHKYKYRLILDESISFGTVGRTGRGLTELYNVPATQIDMIIGSRIVVDHQHINSTSFVFSAAVPALLAVSASEGINILRNTPSILSTLQENVRAIRAVLDRVKAITIVVNTMCQRISVTIP